MRYLLTILATVLLTSTLLLPKQTNAQSPQKMSYQLVIRGSNEALITNTEIGMKISILQGSESGTAVYVETQTPTTNTNGLVSLEIGAGTVQSGDFSTIEWANGDFFIKTETDPAGGTSYSISVTNELLSVPFALHTNETDPSVPTGTAAGQMQYWNGTVWTTVATGTEGAILTFVNGVPTWEVQQTFGTVENPTTGKIWMDRNLGASQVATSGTDANAYGDLYQWGRLNDGHQIRTSGITSALSNTDIPGHGDFITSTNFPFDWRNPQNDNLWQGVSGINNPCPDGYRLPTEAELDAERQSWSSNNAAGAFASPLKLTAAGYRSGSIGALYDLGSGGSYWTSNVGGNGAQCLYFHSSDAYIFNFDRAFGYSVRCIKE